MLKLLLIPIFILLSLCSYAQLLKDNFEGESIISSWYADDAEINISYNNHQIDQENASVNVLRYADSGGDYANIGFDTPQPIALNEDSPFTLKVYIPSNSITGNQPNQISLKLQNRNQAEPWSNQTEIIKSVGLDEWQTLTFDFAEDNFINLNPNSPNPISRDDFNRVVLQVNGENNNDLVVAYIDDFYFEGGETSNDPGNPNDPVYDELVWSDEFETNGALNNENWFHQTELPNGNSWFNGEIQHYTDRLDNTFVEDGVMHLVAKKETFTDQGVTKEYTSARLNSKFTFTYGRVEVRAKLPTGVGTWPAIWMLGKNIQETGGYWDNQGYGTTPWPACGEIDIMEHWGDNQNYISSAMHTPSSYGGTINHGGQVIPTASTAFHVYTLDWYEDRMVFSVDGNVHYVYDPDVQNPDTWPFTEDQYILLNTAIQPSIDPNFTESTMEIDYVRVYQESALSTTEVSSDSRLNISPNPVKRDVTVINPSPSLDQNLEIYTIQGQLIEVRHLDKKYTEIDMSGWDSGVYLFKQKSNKANRTYKIIKN
jgi:beta-glucanase (GH16 family)